MRRLIIAVAAIAVVTTTVATVSQSQAPAAQGAGAKGKGGHPRIHAAIKALEAAKAELVAAPHDFGGHRADAVKAVDNAVSQLNLALQFANK